MNSTLLHCLFEFRILVLEKLQELLNESALADIEIHINNMNNANLIGTGIAALS